MYCKYCGSKLDDAAHFCPNCGSAAEPVAQPPYASPAQQPYTAQQPYAAPVQPSNTLAIIGFILSFFISIAGLICSIIGYRNAPQYGGNGRSLAIAGIVISAVSIAVEAFLIIYYFVILFGWGAAWAAL